MLTGIWVMDMIVGKQRIPLISTRMLLPFAALTVIVFLSFVNGQLPWFAFASRAPITAQLGGVAIFVLTTAVFLIAAHLISDLVWLKWMTWIYLALGALFFLMQIIPLVRNYSFQEAEIE